MAMSFLIFAAFCNRFQSCGSVESGPRAKVSFGIMDDVCSEWTAACIGICQIAGHTLNERIMAENFVNDTDDESEQFEIERIAAAGCPNLGPSFWETGDAAEPDPDEAGRSDRQAFKELVRQ